MNLNNKPLSTDASSASKALDASKSIDSTVAIAPAELTDERIVALVQRGDKEKFGVLMSRYDKKLVR